MRMQTVWRVSKTAIFKDDIPGFLRERESPMSRIVTCEMEMPMSHIKHGYHLIKRRGFTCLSIKLFFEGKLPDLLPYGFVKEGSYYVYPVKQLDVSAIPYGKNEWCYLIEKRSGHGVPMHAFDELPFIQEEYQQKLWEENSS